jgi:hypothetical protein
MMDDGNGRDAGRHQRGGGQEKRERSLALPPRCQSAREPAQFPAGTRSPTRLVDRTHRRHSD